MCNNCLCSLLTQHWMACFSHISQNPEVYPTPHPHPPPLLCEMVVCAAVSPHLHRLSPIQVQWCLPLWLLVSDSGHFSNGVNIFWALITSLVCWFWSLWRQDVTVADSSRDMELLTRPTFSLSPKILDRDSRASNSGNVNNPWPGPTLREPQRYSWDMSMLTSNQLLRVCACGMPESVFLWDQQCCKHYV